MDQNELLPFCMRCFNVGAVCDDRSNFCHMCGSEGTCINVARKDIEYMRENIHAYIDGGKRKYNEDQCKKDTMEHINQVRELMIGMANELLRRAMRHDQSKLVSPELEVFTEFTPKLKTSTYGSDEYKTFLKEMKVALDHHYSMNSHHPEHYENGIHGMDLMDIVEMFCDWKAATMRHDDGDIYKSIEFNKKRFRYSDDLEAIFNNTAASLEEPF